MVESRMLRNPDAGFTGRSLILKRLLSKFILIKTANYLDNYRPPESSFRLVYNNLTWFALRHLLNRLQYFTGDLIFARELMIEAINILKSAFVDETFESQGIILLGTVYNDLYDIGKKIFKKMAEAVGFEVIDLGINVEVENFVHYAKEIKPQFIGLSGVLTHTIFSMSDTIDSLKAAGVDAKIIIGG